MKFIKILLLLISFYGFSQDKYLNNNFRSPLDIPVLLSGTFGELRNNHFHSGLDIKTKGIQGLKVYAVADGYVSRIRVSQYGFGKAIYVTHPNGYTTVYAHLNKYALDIEKYVKLIQYRKKEYVTGNIYLNDDKFLVKKGEVIAYSGDSGGSSAPHLHYEVRDSETEKIINPLFFNLYPKDRTKPTIKSLMIYTLNDKSRINKKDINLLMPVKKISNGIYKIDKFSANGNIGIGINTFDKLDNANNKNGIYSLEMFVNNNRVYYHDLETFSFSESKLINLLIDYDYFKKNNTRIQKIFKVDKNNLSIYKDLKKNGELLIRENFNYDIKIITKDFEGNSSILKFQIQGEENNTIISKEKDTSSYKILANKFQKYTFDNIMIAFPENTFYQDCYLDIKKENDIIKIHEPIIPLNKSYKLTFDVSEFSEKEKQQLYIANVDRKKYPVYQFTHKKEKLFYTTTKSLGKFQLLSDKEAPIIKPLFFEDEQWISNAKTLKIKISDTNSGIKSHYATINNEWILMEYNHKKGILTYNFKDKILFGSKHIFKLVVLDNVLNKSTITKTFYRK